jgi:protease YdgD
VFFGLDQRIYPDSTQAPWRMIGRITYESGGHCSGALVGPSTVLTAAHCMFGGDGPRGLDTALEFIAGASGPNWVERARVIDFYIPPQFDINLHSSTSEVDGYDWAFLTLDRPIGNTVGWMLIEPLATAELESAVLAGRLNVMQGGYGADHMEFLAANLNCPVIDVWDDNTIYHECDTLEGDSGSPLFVAENGSYRIIALESATYTNDEGPYDYNMAVDARAFWPVSHKFTN